MPRETRRVPGRCSAWPSRPAATGSTTSTTPPTRSTCSVPDRGGTPRGDREGARPTAPLRSRRPTHRADGPNCGPHPARGPGVVFAVSGPIQAPRTRNRGGRQVTDIHNDPGVEASKAFLTTTWQLTLFLGIVTVIIG